MNLADLVAKHCPLGRQKRCPKCDEWWPADNEFFYVIKASAKRRERLSSWCIDCSQQATYAARERRKAA